MVVKDRRGRRRYIVFRVSPELDRETLIKRTRRIREPDRVPYIIQCSDGLAVIRCSPDRRDDMIEVMSDLDPGCTSLATSGTLKTLRDRYPGLRAGHVRR